MTSVWRDRHQYLCTLARGLPKQVNKGGKEPGKKTRGWAQVEKRERRMDAVEEGGRLECVELLCVLTDEWVNLEGRRKNGMGIGMGLRLR